MKISPIFSDVARKDQTTTFLVEIVFFKKAQKGTKYLGNFCTKICQQLPSKIAQSGHTTSKLQQPTSAAASFVAEESFQATDGRMQFSSFKVSFKSTFTASGTEQISRICKVNFPSWSPYYTKHRNFFAKLWILGVPENVGKRSISILGDLYHSNLPKLT